MTHLRHVVWAPKLIEGACSLTPLAGVDKQFELLEGLPRAAGFPQDASFAMDPDYPDDMVLTDNLVNVDMLLVVSERLAAVFQQRNAEALEYLPVTIFDHRGRPVAPKYFILHPMKPIDCLDLGQCGATRSRVAPSMINDVERLVLDESRIDPNRLLFRPLGFPKVALVRRDVAEQLDHEGFTGIRWVEPSDYPEI